MGGKSQKISKNSHLGIRETDPKISPGNSEKNPQKSHLVIGKKIPKKFLKKSHLGSWEKNLGNLGSLARENPRIWGFWKSRNSHGKWENSSKTSPYERGKDSKNTLWGFCPMLQEIPINS